MSDTATADTATDATTTDTSDAAATDATDWQAEAEKFKALARKQEDRAKANANAAKELEELRKASMSDLEKAVAEAKAQGRSEGLAESASKIVQAEFKAAAAGRLDNDALATLLEGINLLAFVDQDGDVDSAKVQSFVDGITPATQPQPEPDIFQTLDLGQGSRTDPNTVALNSDELLKAVMDKVGPRKPR